MLLNCGFGNLPYTDWLPSHQRMYSKIPVISSSDQFRIGNAFSSVFLLLNPMTYFESLSHWSLWSISFSEELSRYILCILNYSSLASILLLFSSHHLTSVSHFPFWAPSLFPFFPLFFGVLLIYLPKEQLWSICCVYYSVKFSEGLKSACKKGLSWRPWL